MPHLNEALLFNIAHLSAEKDPPASRPLAKRISRPPDGVIDRKIERICLRTDGRREATGYRQSFPNRRQGAKEEPRTASALRCGTL
jgi:hypothetical protein